MICSFLRQTLVLIICYCLLIFSTQADASAAVLNGVPSLTLREAITHALSNNLDAAVRQEEQMVAQEQATGAYLRMLPNLMLNGEFSEQNHSVPSSSKSWNTGTESLEPSVSHDLQTTTYSAELSWNVLNLATSYMRAGQADNDWESTKLRYRRVKQNLILDVTRAYMRCATAKEAAEKAAALIDRAENRLHIIQGQMARQAVPIIDGLQAEINIIKLKDRLRNYAYEYKQAKKDLAQLMGQNPDKGYFISGIDLNDRPGPFPIDLAAWEQEALKNRPEMKVYKFDEKNAQSEAQIAMVEMAPTVTPFVKYSYDDNSYLSRHDWVNYGLRVSWDLLSIPQLYSKEKTAGRRVELVRRERQAKALAVIVQLHLAVLDYRNALVSLQIATELEEKQALMQAAVHSEAERGTLNESLLLQTDQEYMQARVARLQAYTALISSKARIFNALGRDFDQQVLTAAGGFTKLASKE